MVELSPGGATAPTATERLPFSASPLERCESGITQMVDSEDWATPRRLKPATITSANTHVPRRWTRFLVPGHLRCNGMGRISPPADPRSDLCEACLLDIETPRRAMTCLR